MTFGDVFVGLGGFFILVLALLYGSPRGPVSPEDSASAKRARGPKTPWRGRRR